MESNVQLHVVAKSSRMPINLTFFIHIILPYIVHYSCYKKQTIVYIIAYVQNLKGLFHVINVSLCCDNVQFATDLQCMAFRKFQYHD